MNNRILLILFILIVIGFSFGLTVLFFEQNPTSKLVERDSNWVAVSEYIERTPIEGGWLYYVEHRGKKEIVFVPDILNK